MVRALRTLHRAFRSYPLLRRVHILGRFMTCPFRPVLSHVPAGGEILEIGAGDGILLRLALEGGARRATGVEPDLRKSLAVDPQRSLGWVAGYDQAIEGTFDCVAMLDVLYRVPRQEWEPLFRRIAARVANDGVFLLKELDPDRGWKSAWNRAQEAISDRFLHLTLGEGMSYESVERVRELLLEAGFATVEIIPMDRGYPHAHVLWKARRVITGSTQ